MALYHSKMRCHMIDTSKDVQSDYIAIYSSAVCKKFHYFVILFTSIRPFHYVVLVQPRKTCPFITEILLMGREETDQINNSSTPRLYSQWLNSVIYWLINHCSDWVQTNVTSFSRQYDFHDVIYHNRRRNVVHNYLTFIMYVKIRVSVQTRVAGNSDSLFKMAESL